MYKKVIVFAVCFALAFGEGYLFLSSKAAGDAKAKSAQTEQAAQPKAPDKSGGNGDVKNAAASTAAVDKNGEIFSKLGCIACHSIEALGVKGGQVGPDLSTIYTNVESKHGMKLEDFLKKPNSAVMSGVIGGKPLTDDELKAVVAALKTASDQSSAK